MKEKYVNSKNLLKFILGSALVFPFPKSLSYYRL